MKIFILSPTNTDYVAVKQMYKTERFIDKNKPYAKFYFTPEVVRYANYEICTAKNGNPYLKIRTSTKGTGYNNYLCLFDYAESKELTAAFIKTKQEEYLPILKKYYQEAKEAYKDGIYPQKLKTWLYQNNYITNNIEFVLIDFFDTNNSIEN